MSGENVVSTLDGMFKVQYAKDIVDLKPQHAILQKLIGFVPSDKQNGKFYAVPTLLRSNQGVTYLGESGAVGTLKSSKNAVMKEAQIYGSEVNIRGQMSYKALSQAATAGARAFKKASAWLVEDLSNVAFTRLEIAALYGQSGLGTISAVGGSGPYTLTITTAEFAAGIWVLLEGATLEFLTGLTLNSSTARNTANVNSVGTVTAVDSVNGIVTVTLSGGSAAPQANDYIFFEGACTFNGSSQLTGFNEMAGLYKQMTTTSGTLFNIDRTSYSLMQGNVKSSVGTISKGKIVDAVMGAVDKGCLADLVCLVGTKAFAALNAEDMALRQFDNSYTPEKSQSGAKSLIYENVNGSIKVVCHPMVKAGQALIFNPDDVVWVGSSEPTFEIPGMAEKFFRLVQDSNAIELQNYADLAIYVEAPGRTATMTGIS